jgi:hypothetical protein
LPEHANRHSGISPKFLGDVTMAEEEKQEEQASSEQEQASETQAQEQAQETTETVDWEARHKEAEAELTKAKEAAAESERLIELVTPHVDWNAVQGTKPTETTTEEEGEEQFVSAKSHKEALQAVRQENQMQLLTMQFRLEHPDLRPYEDTLIVPEIVRLRRAHPNLNAAQLLTKATKNATDFLEAERAKGTEKAKEEQEAKARETARASGFASTGTTAPKKDESQGGESTEDYIARRKEQSRRNRGLI